MARGYPDYSNPVYTLASKNIDFDILATAIMRAQNVDGRGRIIYYDRFDEGVYAWDLSYGGNAATPVATTENVEFPPAALLLYSGTVAGSGYSQIQKSTHVGTTLRAGLQVGNGRIGGASKVTMSLGYVTGGHKYTATLKLNNNTGVLSIVEPSGERVIATVGVQSGDSLYTPMKIVADFTDNSYYRAIVGVQEWDLNAYDLEDDTPYTGNMIIATVRCDPVSAVESDLYIGHVILTLDDP